MTWLMLAVKTRLGRALGVVLAILAALGLARAKWRSDGRKDAKMEVWEDDVQRADDIRRRARDADGVPVDDDDRGWRD